MKAVFVKGRNVYLCMLHKNIVTFLASESIVLYVWKVSELFEVFVSVGMHVCMHVCMCVCVCVCADTYSGYLLYSVQYFSTLYSICVWQNNFC